MLPAAARFDPTRTLGNRARLFLAALQAGDYASLRAFRTAVVVAHPDDETIGIGGHLSHLGSPAIVHATDGAPRDLVDARAAGFSDWRSYAEARRHELAAAMAEAGVDGTGLVCLAVPDKEAVHHLVDLARRLADLFRAHRIEVVATHAYEGGHADHDAAAFAVHAAAALLAREGVEPPGIVEMPFYTWRGEGLLPLRFLPRPDAPETAIRLDPAALALKRRMLAAFRTQARVLADFSAASIERFRRAPRHDFTRPANGGDTGYARITPAIDARRWCLFAAKAERELGLR